MDFLPLKVTGTCVADDETLFANMEKAILWNYPEVLKVSPIRSTPIAIIGSGPSIAGQLDLIKKIKAAGTPIVAIKDSHDWLIENGVIPDYALAIDPQAHRWNCFKLKHPDVKYMIASQCHPNMFDHLAGMNITIWHPYITKGQKRPLNKMVIGGGTTSGLRAISLFYVLGWRHMALFGFDSCMDGKMLRVNGDGAKESEIVSEVRIDPNGETFYCTSAMALQAEHFQTYYDFLPDIQFYAFGKGLIQAIIKLREENTKQLLQIQSMPKNPNKRVSFIHSGDKDSASWRYRASIPSREMGLSMNDIDADTLIFSKPQAYELMEMAKAKTRGAKIIVEFCDDHFTWPHYIEALALADHVTCPTPEMARIIKTHGREATVVPDPYEYPQEAPHCAGTNLLWYGHKSNLKSLERVYEGLFEYPIRIVSNSSQSIPWSYKTMLQEFKTADIVIIPATQSYKSANRAVEAIRQGCFVVAEPHPAVMEIPAIWIGDIKEGVEWTSKNLKQARTATFKAQKYVMEKYSPQTCASMWKTVMGLPTT